MLLRRVIDHVRSQNWFAVWLDFVIVVVGVFLGIQIGNWNEERVFNDQEEMLLLDLRSEIEDSASRAGSYWRSYLGQVSEAGARSIAFINSGKPCTDDCWERIIDFFHASQFISLELDRTVLDEMQRLGLPRDRNVETVVSAYYLQGRGIALNLNERPEYRKLVRELIPHDMMEELWRGCHDVNAGIEALTRSCTPTSDDATLRAVVDEIRTNTRIKQTLNHWTTMTNTIRPYLDDLVEEGDAAIKAIDAALGRAR